MPRPWPLIAPVLAACALAGCGGDDEKGQGQKTGGERDAATSTGAQTTTGATTTARSPEARCRKVPAPKPKPRQRLPAPTVRLDPEMTWRALVRTSCGEFTITLDVERAPRTASSFAHLARRGFFDGLTFHRVINAFVIQGGDPQGNGMGGPGYKVVEPPPKNLRYTRGIVAMAKTEIEEPGTSGSQFYVVTGPDAQLPAEYALAGRVTQGQEVVDAIDVIPTNQTSPDPEQRDRPVDPVVIEKVTITGTKAEQDD